MNLQVWRRSVDFRLQFSLEGFCVLYFILSEFLTKDVLWCTVNPREICTYNNFCLIIYLFIIIINIITIAIIVIIIIIISILFLILMGFLHFNKVRLSERFSLLSRSKLLLLKQFLFCFNVFIFSYDYQSWFSFLSLSFWLFLLLLFSSLSLSLSFLHLQCF